MAHRPPNAFSTRSLATIPPTSVHPMAMHQFTEELQGKFRAALCKNRVLKAKLDEKTADARRLARKRREAEAQLTRVKEASEEKEAEHQVKKNYELYIHFYIIIRGFIICL